MASDNQDIQLKISTTIDSANSAKQLTDLKTSLNDLKTVSESITDKTSTAFNDVSRAIEDTSLKIQKLNSNLEGIDSTGVENLKESADGISFNKATTSANTLGAALKNQKLDTYKAQVDDLTTAQTKLNKETVDGTGKSKESVIGLKEGFEGFDDAVRKTLEGDLGGALKGVTEGFEGLGNVLKTNPLFLLVGVIGLIVANFDRLKAAGGAIGAVFSGIGAIVGSVVRTIKDMSDAIGLTTFRTQELSEQQKVAAAAQLAATNAQLEGELKLAAIRNTDQTVIENQIALNALKAAEVAANDALIKQQKEINDASAPNRVVNTIDKGITKVAESLMSDSAIKQHNDFELKLQKQFQDDIKNNRIQASKETIDLVNSTNKDLIDAQQNYNNVIAKQNQDLIDKNKAQNSQLRDLTTSNIRDQFRQQVQAAKDKYNQSVIDLKKEDDLLQNTIDKTNAKIKKQQDEIATNKLLLPGVNFNGLYPDLEADKDKVKLAQDALANNAKIQQADLAAQQKSIDEATAARRKKLAEQELQDLQNNYAKIEAVNDGATAAGNKKRLLALQEQIEFIKTHKKQLDPLDGSTITNTKEQDRANQIRIDQVKATSLQLIQAEKDRVNTEIGVNIQAHDTINLAKAKGLEDINKATIKQIEDNANIALHQTNITEEAKAKIIFDANKAVQDQIFTYNQQLEERKLTNSTNKASSSAGFAAANPNNINAQLQALEDADTAAADARQKAQDQELKDADTTGANKLLIIQKYNNLELAAEKKLEDDKRKARLDGVNRGLTIAKDYSDSLTSINDLFNTQENENLKAEKLSDTERAKRKDELLNKQFKRQKAFAAITAGINTAQAITGALAQPGPIGVNIAEAIAIGVMGAAQIAAILAANYESSSASGGSDTTSATPLAAGGVQDTGNPANISAPSLFGLGNSAPNNFSGNADQRVYVLESDITKTQKKVSNIQQANTI